MKKVGITDPRDGEYKVYALEKDDQDIEFVEVDTLNYFPRKQKTNKLAKSLEDK